MKKVKQQQTMKNSKIKYNVVDISKIVLFSLVEIPSRDQINH